MRDGSGARRRRERRLLASALALLVLCSAQTCAALRRELGRRPTPEGERGWTTREGEAASEDAGVKREEGSERMEKRRTEERAEDSRVTKKAKEGLKEAGEALERLLPTLQAQQHEAFLNVSPARTQKLTTALELKYGENGHTVDLKKATQLLQELAEEEVHDAATAQALYELGDLQIRGYPGVLRRITRDLNRAVEHFRASALFGYGPALHALGVAYAIGLGSLEPNEAEAARLHYLASLTDYIPAILAMGFRFLYGDGVAADCETALRYYKFAAERTVQFLAPGQDDGSAALFPPPPLGDSDRLTEQTDAQWRELQTVQTQQKEILQYWEHQAKDGNPMAQYELAKLREQQQPAEATPSGSRSPEAENQDAERMRQVAELYEASGKQGLAPALRDLGLLYLQGQGVERSFPKAIECLKQAAELGDPESQNYLGYLYYFGTNAPSPSPSASHLAPDLQPFSAPSSSPPLSASSSSASDDAFSIPRNETLAVHYFRQAALKEFPEALFFLGEIEVEGYTAAEARGEAADRGRAAKPSRARREAEGEHAEDDAQERRRGGPAGGEKEAAGRAEKGRRDRHEFRAETDTRAKPAERKRRRTNTLGTAAGSLVKALRFYQRAADGGYILAAWREGQLLEAGKGAPRSCEDATLAYKLVAEAGPLVDDIRKGFTQYVSGDLEGALLTYAFAAEEGFEVAQANAAFLYTRFRPSWEFAPLKRSPPQPKAARSERPPRRPRVSVQDPPQGSRDGERDPSAPDESPSFWSFVGNLLWGAKRPERRMRDAKSADATKARREPRAAVADPDPPQRAPEQGRRYAGASEGDEEEAGGCAETGVAADGQASRSWSFSWRGDRAEEVEPSLPENGEARAKRRWWSRGPGETDGENGAQTSAFGPSRDERRRGEELEGDRHTTVDPPAPRLPQIYRMWNRAALQGNPEALREIAQLHIKGSADGVVVASPELSAEVLKISAAHGDVKSLPILASLYESGTSVTPPLYGRAIDLLKIYAEGEEAHAAAGPQQILRSGAAAPWQGWRKALQRRFKRWGLAAQIGRLTVKDKWARRREERGEKAAGVASILKHMWWRTKREK
ncbi:Sel1 repeat-containing protein [Besnoitia besnoiti]|uniref:Sel1 repeat-containing protein n=1 Tax=Besnoitia besnoiti TaxID=94643 RepID=A0A2A9M8K4_BESBE|nr:Sel1 repeat-containing protein [Besnoitia besnoiti]PFH34315.1 Sel1 repeat-containing protein [Besnoitia besnoiti]